jgi:hypothetical protein
LNHRPCVCDHSNLIRYHRCGFQATGDFLSASTSLVSGLMKRQRCEPAKKVPSGIRWS